MKKLIIKSNLNYVKWLVSIILLLILNVGCSQIPLPEKPISSLLPNLASEANFQIRVTPTDIKGEYKVEGSTNLPDQSRITIAAIRYLDSDKELSPDFDKKPTYSILAYKDVKVSAGKWQTNLKLWKVAPDGQFKEIWQLDQPKLGLSLAPAQEVIFFATYAPTASLSDLEWQLEKQGIKLVSSLIRNTADGERYIQALQVLPIPLPNGQTTPPQQQPEDINGGWGPRYLLLPEPPNITKLEKPSKRRTEAPLSPAEFLQ